MSRKILSGAIGIAMLCVFAYGIVQFPDAPIHSCGQKSYCGKQGQSHTYEDYVAYSYWHTAFFCVWPIGLLGLVLLSRRNSA